MSLGVELMTAEAPTPRLDHAAVEAARLVTLARDRLVAESPSLTVAMLADGRSVSENTARQWLQRRRQAGALITVEYAGTVLIPGYQLDEAFEPLPLCAEATKILTGAGMSGWAVWRWFCAVNPWIGRPPADLLRSGDRHTLLAVACRLAGADPAEADAEPRAAEQGTEAGSDTWPDRPPLKVWPGQPAPRSGRYVLVGPRGGAHGEVSAVEGQRLPPTPRAGQSYQLVDPRGRKNPPASRRRIAGGGATRSSGGSG